MTARDLLKENHPLRAKFVDFCGDKPVTLRQARKFLQKFPKYREATEA